MGPELYPHPDLTAAKRPRRLTWIWIALALMGAVVAACALAAGGFFGYRALVTQPTETALALNSTATSRSAATATQVAVVTGTAQSQATATGIAGATSTARAEATGTRVAAVTGTADAIVSVLHDVPSGWHLVQRQTFDRPNNDWRTGAFSDEFVTAEASIDNGEYTWTMTSKQGVVYFAGENGIGATDSYVSVDARLDSGFAGTEYGIYFRYSHALHNYYLFSISNQGTYELLLRDHEAWTELRSGASTFLVSNGANTIAVLAIGPQITLYVNGKQIAQLTDSTLTEGTQGVSMLLPYGGLTATVVYDNFLVIGPP